MIGVVRLYSGESYGKYTGSSSCIVGSRMVNILGRPAV